jgi:glyoxylase-like metal-dependent hydrolase (beta-lactamase superfamily II)
MRNESSPSRIPQPAKIAIAFAATLTLFACGGGGEDIGDGRSIPLKAGNAMPKPPAFVPLAVALPDDASEYDKHMQVARISWAYNDDITAPHWCANPGQGGNPNLGIRDVVPITEIFDGFYFTGTVSVGQFAMKTSDGGYILFDTMNNATDVANITVPQLQSAGIDPATLRGLVVTHGHGDHDGGAPELQARYSPPTTVVGSADYNANKRYVATIQVNSTKAGVPEQLTINGATFTAMATPGHTPGTTSFILPVTYKGQPHKIAYWGGSGLPGSASGRLQYMQGAEAMYAQIKEQQADASINSHSWEDKGLDRIRAIQAQGGIGASNPMIQGTAKIQLGFATLRSCAAAQLSNADATARNPVWRPTRTELYAVRPNANGKTTHVRARVSNYFNVVSNGIVTFTTAEGDSCTATTDDEGIANCVIQTRGGGAPGPTSVTAEFQEISGSAAVELSSFDTVNAANY